MYNFITTDDISNIKLDAVLPGLQTEGDDEVLIPLRALQVTAKLIDLAAEVRVHVYASYPVIIF